jgi:hypothetical protein
MFHINARRLSEEHVFHITARRLSEEHVFHVNARSVITWCLGCFLVCCECQYG